MAPSPRGLSAQLTGGVTLLISPFLTQKRGHSFECPHGIRRRPTLPGRFQPSTISVLRLNFCVRDGNRWIPQAIVTGNMGFSRSPFRTLKTAQVRFHFALSDHDAAPLLALTFFLKSSSLDQALDRLVSPSSIHCCTSTDDLSTLSSSRGLTCS